VKEILYIEDWAELDGCCRQTVYNRIADGSIPRPIRRPGQNRPFWTRQMRDRWLQKLEAEAAA
jgi:predicted DNA-binding transcriptional regulator AlpA